jgi:Protein of unknown function, DUF488/Oxidoreductase molybdopterin binding domain
MASDEESSFPSTIALPGHENLGPRTALALSCGFLVAADGFGIRGDGLRHAGVAAPPSDFLADCSRRIARNASLSQPPRRGNAGSIGAGRRSADDSAYEMNGQPLPILHGAPLRLRVAARIHHGEVHPRDRVYRGLHNHWPGPRRLARRLSVFQPGSGNLIQNVCTSTVLTIGHSTRAWKVFLDLLRAHRVERVIDVRSIPGSQHNPQFNQDTLCTKLRAARIGYVHLRKLGGLRHARCDSSNLEWRNRSFRGFADYMQTSEFDAGYRG